MGLFSISRMLKKPSSVLTQKFVKEVSPDVSGRNNAVPTCRDQSGPPSPPSPLPPVRERGVPQTRDGVRAVQPRASALGYCISPLTGLRKALPHEGDFVNELLPQGTSIGYRFRNLFRLVALPLLQAPEEALMGGQAVIEGVMMRSPHSYAVAVRQPSGAIAVAKDYLEKPSEKHPWLRYPLLRGLGSLGQAMVLGVRALRYSAEQAHEEPGKPAQGEKKAELSNWLLAANLALSLGFFVFFYKYVPLSLATAISRHYPATGNLLIFNLLDGTIRIVLFLAFLFFISQWKEIQRIFEYHGAEHKVVWAFEKRGAIDLATARTCTRFHPRCGTSFLLVVMAIAMVLYMFLPFRSFAMRFVGRLALLPVIVGVSYEFIRFAAKSQGKLWRCAAQPGLWLQRVTTREPDDPQLETAIKAIETAMELEKARGGELVVA